VSIAAFAVGITFTAAR